MNGLAGAWRLVSTVTVAACLHAPLAAAGPGLGGGDGLEVSLGRIVTAMVICIIIAVLAILMIRQRSGKLDLSALAARVQFRTSTIQVVETRRLSPHADVCLLRHDGREFLLLLMAGDARVLRESQLPEPEEMGRTCE